MRISILILGFKGLKEGINNTANTKGGTDGQNLKKIERDCSCGF